MMAPCPGALSGGADSSALSATTTRSTIRSSSRSLMPWRGEVPQAMGFHPIGQVDSWQLEWNIALALKKTVLNE